MPILSATAGNGCVQSALSSKMVVPVQVAVAVKVHDHDPVKGNVNDYGCRIPNGLPRLRAQRLEDGSEPTPGGWARGLRPLQRGRRRRAIPGNGAASYQEEPKRARPHCIPASCSECLYQRTHSFSQRLNVFVST